MAETKPAPRTCSTCGRTVRSTRRGMCSNCYRIWQRDNFPPNATCETCSREYFRRPSASSNGRTCSRECYAVWKRGRDQHNQPTEGATQVDRACEWCGCSFTVEKRQINKGLGRFCSLRCSGARRAVPRLVMACEWCDADFEMLPNRVFFVGARFCSRDCWKTARRSRRVARESGRDDRAYRRFRDAWLAEARACERCGSSTDLLLHHRVRTRERPDLLYAPDNLEVLCRSCHSRHHNEMGHMCIPEAAA